MWSRARAAASSWVTMRRGRVRGRTSRDSTSTGCTFPIRCSSSHLPGSSHVKACRLPGSICDTDALLRVCAFLSPRRYTQSSADPCNLARHCLGARAAPTGGALQVLAGADALLAVAGLCEYTRARYYSSLTFVAPMGILRINDDGEA
jgi:hypothetical protein